jgi:hypothetical protein
MKCDKYVRINTLLEAIEEGRRKKEEGRRKKGGFEMGIQTPTQNWRRIGIGVLNPLLLVKYMELWECEKLCNKIKELGLTH